MREQNVWNEQKEMWQKSIPKTLKWHMWHHVNLMNLVVQTNLGRESLSKFVEQPQAKPVCLLSIHCQFSDIDELWDFVNSIFGIIHGLMNKRLSENMAKSFNTCRESF